MRFILTLSNFIELFTRFFIIYFISKILGIEAYGIYSYYIALGQFLSFVFMFGIGPTLLRYIELNRNAYESLVTISFYIFIVVALILFYINIYLFTFFTFYYLLTISIYIYNANENFIYSSILRILIYTIQITLINIYNYTSFYELLQIYSVSNLLLFIVFIFLVKKNSFQVKFKEIKLINSYIYQIYYSQISTSGLRYFEKLIISKILDTQDFGLFSLIRDIINALVYVLYYPIQVIYYKKILLAFKKQESLIRYYKNIVIKISLLCLLGMVIIQFKTLINYITSYIDKFNIFTNNYYILYIILVLIFTESITKLNMMYFDIIGLPKQNSYMSLYNILMLFIIYMFNYLVSININLVIVYIVLINVSLILYFLIKFKGPA